MSPVDQLLEEIAAGVPSDEQFCPAREDQTHCVHWWDDAAGPCCDCKAGGVQFIPATAIPYSAGWYYTVDGLEVGPYNSEADAQVALMADTVRVRRADALRNL